MRFDKEFPGKYTHLIQRLKKPYDVDPNDTSPLARIRADEVFSFGGGKQRGGLSKEAFDRLKPCWSWDYMGAAEFEFGAVPAAFQKLFSGSEFEAFHIEVEGHPTRLGRDWEHDKTRVLKQHVYVFCPTQLKDYATKVITVLALEKYPPKEQSLKEYPRLWSALFDPKFRAESYPTQGWFELDNGFLFFSSKTMWQRFITVLGQTPPEVPDELVIDVLKAEPAPKRRSKTKAVKA